MNWEEQLQNFEYYLKFERNLANNTTKAYLRDLKKLRKFAEESVEKSPEDISHSDLQAYLFENQGHSERSQARAISAIKSFFKFLLEEEIREDNPATLLEAPKLGLYLPDTLSPGDIEKLLDAIEPNAKNSVRSRCIIEVLYGCGLRVSELISLKISDINFKEGFLRVQGKGSKVRLVPLAEFTADVILDYINNERKSVKIQKNYEDSLILNLYGKAISRISIFNLIKELALKAKITKTISPHTFRHSFATHLLQNGADLRFIQEMLGHASITTTEIYTHLETKELHDTIINFHPRNLGKKINKKVEL